MDDIQFKTETVKVVRPEHDGGFAVINKSDLTASDVLFDEAPKAAPRVEMSRKKKSDDSED